MAKFFARFEPRLLAGLNGQGFLDERVGGRNEEIIAAAGDAWAQRVHRVDGADFLGWLAYPQSHSKPVPAASVPATIVVEDTGRLLLEEYVARVVTGELGQSREPQAAEAAARRD